MNKLEVTYCENFYFDFQCGIKLKKLRADTEPMVIQSIRLKTMA